MCSGYTHANGRAPISDKTASKLVEDAKQILSVYGVGPRDDIAQIRNAPPLLGGRQGLVPSALMIPDSPLTNAAELYSLIYSGNIHDSRLKKYCNSRPEFFDGDDNVRQILCRIVELRKSENFRFNIDYMLQENKPSSELYSLLALFFILDLHKFNLYDTYLFNRTIFSSIFGISELSRTLVCIYDFRICNKIISDFVSEFASVNFAYYYGVIDLISGNEETAFFCGNTYRPNFLVIQLLGIAMEFNNSIDLSDALSVVQRAATLRGMNCNG